ncbi:MAG: RluA family pseudouridine synthase [Chloroflexi bacterium]|nr:RluA family pseudouridine synthase [Chloroflexota bacterium]
MAGGKEIIMDEHIVTFVAETAGERLDRALAARFPDLSRAQLQRLIKSGDVTVDGRPSKPAYHLEVGQEVSVTLPEETESAVLPESIRLNVVFEDETMLVVDKPAGMVVHPAYGHTTGTLVNAILAHCPEVAHVGGPERAGIVHRLDKDTSGLIVVAKTDLARTALQRQFKHRQVAKTYIALVEGHVYPKEGVIEVPIGRDKRDRKRMGPVREGREALTSYRVLEHFEEHTLVEVRPHTGRTHQIRVHLAWLGYPIVGDAVYGHRRQRLLKARHFLHAAKLRVTHPKTQDLLEFEAPMPHELMDLVRRLRRSQSV